jgi:hypothetical protein
LTGDRSDRDNGDGAWAAIDAYVDWALGPGREHYFRQEPDNQLMPLLLRLRLRLRDRPLHDVLEEIFGDAGRSPGHVWELFFKIILFRTPPTPGGSVTVWLAVVADARHLERINAPAAARFLESVSLGRLVGFPGLEALRNLPASPPKHAQNVVAIPQDMVVMGVIDDAIAFAHERFDTLDNGTRVAFCWLQGPGIFLDNTQIDDLLDNYPDEEDLYRTAGQYDFHSSEHKSAAWRVAHGTHVMDLACGCDPADNREDRPIVCVQLPVAATADENPGSLFVWIALAIDYIVNCAIAIAEANQVEPKVVINLSYGLLAGPHDGTDSIEQYIDDMILRCENQLGVTLRVILPSGNSYLSRIHARLSFAGGPPIRALTWCVQPDDRTPSRLEVWLPSPRPAPGDSRITLRITSPTGAFMEIDEHGLPVEIPGPADSYAWAYWLEWLPSDRSYFVVIVQSTAHPDPSAPLVQIAPAGRWRVELTYTGGVAADDVVDVWIQRDDQIYGFPLRGRQSYFDDPDYQRFDHAGREQEFDNNSLVQRRATINSMATGNETIVLGGYLGKEELPAKYSAAGAWDQPPPRWPDAMTLSEDSRVHSGVRAAGSHSGSVVTMGGTSVAAPQIARLVADNLAAGGNGDRAVVAGWGVLPLPQPERSGAGGIEPAPLRPPRYDL